MSVFSKKQKNLLISLLVILSFFLFVNPSIAARKHDIGYECNGNNELCRTGNCESRSIMRNPNSYCVANSADDCAAAYGGEASDWNLQWSGVMNYCLKPLEKERMGKRGVIRRPEPKKIGEECDVSECKGGCYSYKNPEGSGLESVCACDPVGAEKGRAEDRCSVSYGNGNWECRLASDDDKAKVPFCYDRKTDKAYYATKKTVMTETSTGKTGTIKDVLSRDEIKELIHKPSLKEQIPGLNFTEEKQIPIVDEGGTRYLIIPYIGEYIAAVYKWSVAAAGVLATLVIIVSAIQWMFPALNLFTEGEGNQKRTINQAKKRILRSIAGLVIAAGSYVILFTINPELVKFDALKVKFIEQQEVALPASDGSYSPEGSAFSGEEGEKPQDMDDLDKCIYDEFLSGLKIGEAIPTKKVDMWGIKKIKVNENAASYFENAVSNIKNLPNDSKAKGYLRYIKDFNDEKIPDLQGKKDGKGAISQLQGGNGLGRGNQGDSVKFLRSDMHALGLGVDIMTRSNWDVKNMSEAEQYCKTYQETIRNNEDKFSKDRYNEIFKKIKKLDCENLQEVKDINIIPKKWVDIFEANKFYWAGNGWGEKNRSDGMHFELYGPNCLQKRQNKG